MTNKSDAKIIYRELDSSEYDFLNEMLYAALFVPEGGKPFERSILDNPDIARYTENWGNQKGDVSFVAVVDRQLVGAIWGRMFIHPNKGYGYVDDLIPELSMAIKPAFRNQGIGNQLLSLISEKYASLNVQALSLSVDNRNHAKRLYQRSGFQISRKEGTSLIMMKEL